MTTSKKNTRQIVHRNEKETHPKYIKTGHFSIVRLIKIERDAAAGSKNIYMTHWFKETEQSALKILCLGCRDET